MILEPGRYLAAGCGVYLNRVVRTKTSRGEHFAILEGGIGGTGAEGEGETRPTTLAGPLCTGLDRLGRVELPVLRPGHLLVFGMLDAYGATEAMVTFLDHPPAAEVSLPGRRITAETSSEKLPSGAWRVRRA